jgi:Family of unknown function (DUF6006)
MNNNIFRQISIGLFTLTCILPGAGGASASQAATQWYFGNWNNCLIDGRPAKMQWKVVDDPQTSCDGNICSSSSGVKVVGRFSDNGSDWVPLSVRYNQKNEVGIRYLGKEKDNWVLRYNPQTKDAKGYTTWRGKKYPLSCSR